MTEEICTTWECAAFRECWGLSQLTWHLVRLDNVIPRRNPLPVPLLMHRLPALQKAPDVLQTIKAYLTLVQPQWHPSFREFLE